MTTQHEKWTSASKQDAAAAQSKLVHINKKNKLIKNIYWTENVIKLNETKTIYIKLKAVKPKID